MAARRPAGGAVCCVLAALAVPVLASGSAAAQPASQNARASAQALANLFDRTCFRHAGDRDGLRAEMTDLRYRRIPDPAATKALSRPGEAFDALVGPGHPMVLSFDDGWCGDGAMGVDPHALTMALDAAMRTHGMSMRLMGAAEDGREQRYLLSGTSSGNRHPDPIALLVLLQPSGATMQASLFAAPLPAAEAGEDGKAHP